MIENLIRKHFRGFKAGDILDVGPGYNHFGRVAAAATGATSITYMDMSDEVLKWQVLQCSKAGITAKSLSMDLDPISLLSLDGGYDLILCQEVLEHLTEAEAVLSALASKLNPGGRILITVPTRVSERWIKFLNPSYMRDEPYGHVREFDKKELGRVIAAAGCKPLMIVPTQPHMFISHSWLFGTRVRVEGSSGRVLDRGWRVRAWRLINKLSFALFRATGMGFWARLFPRNYFAIAERDACADPR